MLRTAAQQEGLLPALMRTYVAADFVVGLDVDKDSFDKFSMRSCIEMILEELWRDEPCRRSMVNLAAGAADAEGSSSSSGSSSTSAAAFRDYISCTLNSLMYLFKVGHEPHASHPPSTFHLPLWIHHHGLGRFPKPCPKRFIRTRMHPSRTLLTACTTSMRSRPAAPTPPPGRLSPPTRAARRSSSTPPSSTPHAASCAWPSRRSSGSTPWPSTQAW